MLICVCVRVLVVFTHTRMCYLLANIVIPLVCSRLVFPINSTQALLYVLILIVCSSFVPAHMHLYWITISPSMLLSGPPSVPVAFLYTNARRADVLSQGMELLWYGMWHCVSFVLAVTCCTSLRRYKGITAALLSSAPFVGVQMTSFTEVLALLPTRPDGTSAVHHMLLAGAVSGMFAQTLMCV